MPRLTVELGSRTYPVVVDDAALELLGQLLHETFGGARRLAVITDETVAGHHLGTVTAALSAAKFPFTTHQVAAGEASKSLAVAEELIRAMILGGHDRHSAVIALGGGVVGDLAGLVAALFFRGIPLVQVPTTIVAQVDSSVGGKTGVNVAEGKNLIGAFHQPRLVVVDPQVLRTLPDREFREGFAEAVKHAAIRRPEMLAELTALDVPSRIVPPGLLAANIQIKADIVAADEFETTGERALLNFGHTIGHAIEAALPYGEMLHGEAIALGLRAALWLSAKKAGLAPAAADQVLDALRAFQLSLVLPDPIPTARVLELLTRDKKFQTGGIRFVLLRAPGDAFVSNEVSMDDVRAAVEVLREK